MKKLSTQLAFTLIELVVTIGVLSVLIGALLAMINPLAQFQKARDAQRKSDLAQIQKVLEAYYQDKGKYPVSFTQSEDVYKIVDEGDTVIDWGQPWQSYINILPKDPNPSKKYMYMSTGQQYQIYAHLDRDLDDPQTCVSEGYCNLLLQRKGSQASSECRALLDSTSRPCVNAPIVFYCGNSSAYFCNYGVSSPNTVP